MFRVNKQKCYVPIQRRSLEAIPDTLNDSFLDTFINWASSFLLDKTQRHNFKKNISRHCGAESNYNGRNNILKILHAIYHYAHALPQAEIDTVRSLISRIEERANHCTPGFETGICDLAQLLLSSPQSLDELLQSVRQDLVQKIAMAITPDVHGQNHVFRLVATQLSVDVPNPNDPYTGTVNLAIVEPSLTHSFDTFYNSFSLITQLHAKFFSIMDSFGYAENQIDATVHTKISDFIKVIFSNHTQVLNVINAETYLETKKTLEKNALIYVSNLLKIHGYFDIPLEDRESRLADLHQGKIPEWLAESYHEEFSQILTISDANQKQQAIDNFFQENSLFEVEEYVKSTRTKAAYELANTPPSFIRWAKKLPASIFVEIENIRRHTNECLDSLKKPDFSLHEARITLDETFWIEQEDMPFPYQKLNPDIIRIAFFNELKNGGYVESDPLIELILLEKNVEDRKHKILQLIDDIPHKFTLKYFIDLLAIMTVYLTAADAEIHQALHIQIIARLNMMHELDLIEPMLLLCTDFKMALPLNILIHPQSLNQLKPWYFPRMLRIIAQKEQQLDYIEHYYAQHPRVTKPYLILLSHLSGNEQLAFLQCYAFEFVTTPEIIVDVLIKIPQVHRYHFFQTIALTFRFEAELFIKIFNLLALNDRLSYCQLIKLNDPKLFEDKPTIKSIINGLLISERAVLIMSILENHPNFYELITETFNLWQKKDKLYFLKQEEHIAQLDFVQLHKIILRAPISDAEKQSIINKYLPAQTNNFDPIYLLNFEKLLKSINLFNLETLEQYEGFIIRNSFSHSRLLKTMLLFKSEEQRFEYLMNMPAELKNLLIENQLIGDVLCCLKPESRWIYLKHFSQPLTALSCGEGNFLDIIESFTLPERVLIMQEIGAEISSKITSGYGFNSFYNLVLAFYDSKISCIQSLVRDYGPFCNIDNGFFWFVISHEKSLRENILSIFQPKLAEIINRHDLPKIFLNRYAPEDEAEILRCIHANVSALNAKDIYQFINALNNISSSNTVLFLEVLTSYLNTYPISFEQMFDAIIMIKLPKSRKDFIASLSSKHFLMDGTQNDFFSFVQKISIQLSPKVASKMILIFKEDLWRFVQTFEQLSFLLNALTFKEKICILEGIAPHLNRIVLNYENLRDMLKQFGHPHHCLNLLSFLGEHAYHVIQTVEHACQIANCLNVHDQLPFLIQCQFSPEMIKQLNVNNLLNPFAKAYFSLYQEELRLTPHRMFESIHLNTIREFRAIMQAPHDYSTDVIYSKLNLLPLEIKCHLDNPIVLNHLCGPQAELNQKRIKKS